MSLREQVIEKAERKLSSVYRAAISGENIFPWAVPLNRGDLKEDLILWRSEIEGLRQIDKSISGKPGPVIQNKTVNTRKFGEQSFPEKVLFETDLDLVGFLGKKAQYERLLSLVKKSRDVVPEIEPWLLRPSSSTRILENATQWEGILEVCRYFLTRSDFDLYPRLFPLSVHSKFLEENRGLLADILSIVLPDNRKNMTAVTFEERFFIKIANSKIAFRIPDKVLRAKLGIPFSELEVPTQELSDLIQGYSETIQFLIIENKTSYLTFPDIENTVIIFGSGFLVGSLGSYRFLDKGRVIYWGDIDAHGLEILSLVREQAPHTETFLMSEEILNSHWAGSKGKPSIKSEDPIALSPPELKLYRLLKNGEKRLEQEKLPFSLISESAEALTKQV